MKLTITIHMDNAAFEDGNGTEAARILRKLSECLMDADLCSGIDTLYDLNGNCVGTAIVTEE